MKKAALIFLFSFFFSFTQKMPGFDPPSPHPKISYTPSSPYPIEYQQADGSTISIYQKGDEEFSYAKTLDEYTILKDEKGFFYYAVLDAKNELVRSKVRACNAEKRTAQNRDFVASLKKNLSFSKEQIERNRPKGLKSGTTSSSTPSFPTTGARKVLVLCIDYTDKPFTLASSSFDNLFNQNNYNGTGSFKDFYSAVSYNQLTLTTTIVGWYHASGTRASYGAHNGSNNDINAATLIKEAVQAADAAGIDFSQFDNDNNGKVDAVLVIHAGYGEEASADADDIWSHRSNLGASSLVCDGKTVDDYAIFPELGGSTGSTITSIGVICHEFGHCLGLPDYYDTDYATNGQGFNLQNWDLMASGSWNNGGKTPAGINVLGKADLGWLSLTDMNNPFDVINMPNAFENKVGYKVQSPVTNEYFILENRQKVGFDAYLPGHGMLIYHFDGVNWPSMRNKYSTHQCLDLEEADGIQTSATYSGDPFPGTNNVISFTDATTPNMRTWSDQNTGKPITNITENLGLISFVFAGGTGQNPTSFTATASSGSQIDVAWTPYLSKNIVLAYSTSPVIGSPQDGATYHTGDAIPGGGTVLYTGSATSFSHSNLFGLKTYYYKVWTVQDAVPSYSSGYIVNATTPCGVLELPYSQDFESASLPNCWTSFRGANNLGTNDWLIFTNPTYAHGGSRSASVQFEALDGNQKEDWLVMPQLAMPARTAGLQYWERKLNSGNLGNTYSIKVSTSSPTDINSFQTIYSYKETSLSNTNYTQRTINLSHYAGQNIYIAFVVSRDGGDYWNIDDVSVQAMPLPPAAYTQAATNINGSSASLNGTVNASGANTTVTFEYGTTTAYGSSINATPNSANGLSNLSVGANLTGLYGNTTYHYRLKAVNSNGTTYSDDRSFTTSCGLTALPYSMDFETGSGSTLPNCWTAFLGSNGLGTQNWVRFGNSAYAHSGGFSASIRFETTDENTKEGWLASPKMELPINSAVSLSYWERKGTAGNYGTSYSIKVSSASQTDISSYTTVATYSEADLSTTMSQRTIDLSAYSGQTIYIAWVASRKGGDYWFIDDIALTSTPKPLLSQTIDFPSIPSKTYGDASFALSATGGASGNALSYTSSNPAVASISGNIVTLVGVGSSTIYADQAGNAFYLPAQQAARILVVNPREVSWDGSAWAPNTPTINDNAFVNGYYNGAGFPCINLRVRPGKQFSLASGNLNISGNFILECNASDGPATFVNQGNLNLTGKAIVEQSLTGSLNTSNLPNGRFWYVSSPVTGGKSSTFDANGTNKLWYYTEASHSYTEITNNISPLNVGWGYCARMSSNGNISFEGQLNDGALSINASRQNDTNAKRGYNLVGNPYPSFLDWDMVDTTNVSATIWRRTFDNTNMVFTTYNSKSKIGTTVNGSQANSLIAPMQAFWVSVGNSSNTGTIGLSNAMRSHQSGKLLKADNAHPVLRMNISNSKVNDETIILFNSNASNGLDIYDSEKMSNDNANIPEIYTVVENKQVVINGLNELLSKQDIALGFRTGAANNFSLKLSEMSNFPAGTSILLEDKQLSKWQNLLDAPEYLFSSVADTSTTRFVLHLTKSTTDINHVAEQENISIIKGENKLITLKLSGLQSYKGQIAVSTVLGQQVMVEEIKGQETQLAANFQAGVYLFTVLVDGRKVTKKIAITD